ncbi:MAG: class I SAM-dependent methyltransferase [Arenicellales bacterium]
MSDLFKEKASDWDANQMRTQLSSAIGASILAHVPLDGNMAVMDFGAGTGLLTSHVAPRVKSIDAVDTSTAMLEKLVAKPEFQGKVIAVCQDIIELPLVSRYDLIISAMTMHHVEDTDKLFATFAKHLRPGGTIAIADLDKEDGTFHEAGTEGIYHHGFAREELKNTIANNSFVDIHFHNAHSIERNGKSYPVFLVTATNANV